MKRFISSILLCLMVTASVYAEEPKKSSSATPKDYVACFSQWDTKLKTLQTNFVQTTEYDGVLISQSDGKLTYQKEGSKLRLDNTDGQNITQTALTDKKQIWILDEKGQEISTLSWNDWITGQPNQALFDFGNYAALMARHETSVFEHKDARVLLRLKPKDQTQNYTLYVSINEADCFPISITIQSELMKTTALLTQQQVNQALPKDLFKGIK